MTDPARCHHSFPDPYPAPLTHIGNCRHCDTSYQQAKEQHMNQADDLTRQREQLIEAMSGVSEERWCAGWLQGLDHRLHTEGGIWETIGRSIGWPVGDYKAWTWFPWDEAAAIYAQEGGRR